MPVTPKQKHLARAPQEYHDLRVRLAFQRVHLKAICHRYDSEAAEQFPDQGVIYALFDQIVTEQQAYVRTERKMTRVSSKLRFTGDPKEDSKKEKERATINYNVRKLHWGDRHGEENYPSPPNSPSPASTPSRPTSSTIDVWNTFRDTAACDDDHDDDEDSSRQSTKKVHFAELPPSLKRTCLKKTTDKDEDLVDDVAATPLLRAGRAEPDTSPLPRATSSPKKRACVDDDYVQVPAHSPTKKAKKVHNIPWPEAYLFEDLDVFRDCVEVNKAITIEESSVDHDENI